MKMNPLRIVSVLLVSVSLCVTFVGCGKDDEKEREEHHECAGNDDEEFFQKSGVYNGYAYVDLGLPSGLKWATCNVGAANPWEYGDYFAWGETETKASYRWATYLDGRIISYSDCGTDKDLLKDMTDISGTQYDAATANMGSNWRMSTKDELKELIDYCYREWTDNYNGKGVKGCIYYKVKDASDRGKKKYVGGAVITVGAYSLSDIHMFLPAAGYRDTSDLNESGNGGYYWSSSLREYAYEYAYYLYFYSFNLDRYKDYYRYYGYSVRGVYK